MTKRNTATHRRAFALLFILMVSALVFAGCGKKAPPVAPQEKQPPAVSDLKGLRQGDRVLLSWRTPGRLGPEASAPERFRVCRSKQPLQAGPCARCPLIFECVADIPLQSQANADDAQTPMHYSEVLEKGYRYIYKVIGLRSAGPESYGSNLVEIVY
jgi:hypothetical protein